MHPPLMPSMSQFDLVDVSTIFALRRTRTLQTVYVSLSTPPTKPLSGNFHLSSATPQNLGQPRAPNEPRKLAR